MSSRSKKLIVRKSQKTGKRGVRSGTLDVEVEWLDDDSECEAACVKLIKAKERVRRMKRMKLRGLRQLDM